MSDERKGGERMQPDVQPFGEEYRGVHPYRYDRRARIKVDVIPMFVQIEGHRVPQGEHVIDIPQSRLDDVRGLVETELDELRSAERAFERKRAEFAQKHGDAIYNGSVAAEFRLRTDRDIRPLRSMEVLERDLPAPLTESDRRTAETVRYMQSQGRQDRPERHEHQGHHGGGGKHKR